MYQISLIFSVLLYTVECGNYQRYDTTSRYTTTANQYNQFPRKGVNYRDDVATYPEVSKYPTGYSGYPGSSTPSYTSGGGLYNYDQEYNTQRYGGNYGTYSSYEVPFMRDMRDYCINRSPQMGIFVEGLMGMWYGVEIIQHLGGDSRVDFSRTCLVVHISEPRDRPSTENQLYHVQRLNDKFRYDYRHLRLLWDEAGQTIEYSLYFRNDTAGYWQVSDGQNGTLASMPKYQQFSGSVQVLKAVHDHLVLNFCQEPSAGRPAQLYTALFSRDPGTIKSWEIEAVHNLLQTKKLSIASRRMVCGNNAGRTVHSILLSIVSCVLAYVVAKS